MPRRRPAYNEVAFAYTGADGPVEPAAHIRA